MSKTIDKRTARRNPLPNPDLIRVREAAARAGLTRSTIYRWIRNEQISAVKHDGLLYVSLEDVKETQQRNRAAPTAPEAPPQGLVTIHQAAAETGVTKRTLQDWAKDGKIKAQKSGPKIWYVDLSDAREMARTSKPGTKPDST
jgi:excisionase family DNA binding protein